ncbi:MAG: ATP-binding protein [Bacteroidia bacterium]
MYIEREYNLEKLISKKRVLMIYGPRRVGKTTLIKEFLKNTRLKYKLDSGDHIQTQILFGSQDFNKIKDYLEGYELLIIDEAQQIKNIGQTLKIIIDEFPMYVIVSGSSSFELSHNTGEPLTGRKNTLLLYPISLFELKKIYNTYEIKNKLNDWLIYGMYPEVINAKTKKEKRIILQELVDSYLLKDVFSLERIKSPSQFVDLLKLLAFQIGSEVSLNELASQVRLDVKTVARYLDLLEKSYVIKKLNVFNKNKRQEIVSKSKYYFIDNGIRNAIINQFNSPDSRNDMGELFENFIIIEKLKQITYKRDSTQIFFWRTKQQHELDMVLVKDNKIKGLEIKFNKGKIKASTANTFKSLYKNSTISILNKENFINLLF